MESVFHPGEIAVQEREGVAEQARRLGSSVRAVMIDAAQDFLRRQQVAVAGALDAGGRAWASLLTGGEGFLAPVDERTLRVRALPIEGDPLAERFARGGQAGLVAMDLAARRRLRVNGLLEPCPGGALLRTAEVFFNCPKYIQARVVEEGGAPAPSDAPSVERRAALAEPDLRFVALADTFFLASVHDERNADASHRGGPPGFVRAVSERCLLIPDYAGNNMFQTLGNLTVDPRVGLLFVDFERGRTLQLTGIARIEWDRDRLAGLPGARRALEVEIAEVVAAARATSLRLRLVERSPHNPA